MINGTILTSLEKHETLFFDNLLHLTNNNLWKEIKSEPVSIGRDKEVISVFSDNIWHFPQYRVGTEYCSLNFNVDQTDISETFKREIKTVVLAYLYHTSDSYRISSIITKVSILKRLALSLEEINIKSFNGLTTNQLKEVTKKNIFIPREIDMGVLNSLSYLDDYLPFSVNFSQRVTMKLLKSKPKKITQHPVIPYRIYMSALNVFSNEITEWHNYRKQLEDAIKSCIEYEQYQHERVIKMLRNGHFTKTQAFNLSNLSTKKFIQELDKKNIPLIDYEQYPEWSEIYEKHEPSSRTDYYEPFRKITINNKNFNTSTELKKFCRELDEKCRYLILCLSGMRSNELLQIKPEFGAQTISIDGIEICLFHTKQQKITAGYQGENDVYVTTPTGHKAFYLLDAMNKPIRQFHKQEKRKCWFLNSFESLKKHLSVNQSSRVLVSLNKLFAERANSFSVELNSDDIELLRRSDPERNFSVGEKWHLTPHQLRRSLAFYLVGMQLADYPQLKQQLSHYSIAMTMYYARNSSSFAKMYYDIEKERIKQQAQRYSSLVEKAKEGSKFGGGKGKNLYKESLENRDVSPEYFEKEIKQGRKHLHAIAPNMYCLNRMCNMRSRLDLAKSVDCEWAVIESSAYVQAARQESINIMEALNQTNELSPDIISFHTNRLRAAEKIMADMDINFRPFELSQLLLASAS